MLSNKLKDSVQSIIHRDNIVLVRVTNYQVIIRLIGPKLSTAARGDLLLDLELDLQNKIDSRLQVFLEPSGDMNKLRIKLRGVKV